MKRVLSALCCGGKSHPPPAPPEAKKPTKRPDPIRRSSTIGMTTGTAAASTEPGAKQTNRPLHEYRFPRVGDYEDEANVSA